MNGFRKPTTSNPAARSFRSAKPASSEWSFVCRARSSPRSRGSSGPHDYPRRDPVLGLLAPSVEGIANALRGRDAVRIQPSGAYAANLLGLSDQVPMRVVFLTDGQTRRVRIGKPAGPCANSSL
jgi:hypothetical protein